MSYHLNSLILLYYSNGYEMFSNSLVIYRHFVVFWMLSVMYTDLLIKILSLIMMIKNYQMIEHSNNNTENLSKADSFFPPSP